MPSHVAASLKVQANLPSLRILFGQCKGVFRCSPWDEEDGTAPGAIIRAWLKSYLCLLGPH
jgi:hypothetical protein